MSLNSNDITELDIKLRFLQELRALAESDKFSGATREYYAIRVKGLVDNIYRDLRI